MPQVVHELHIRENGEHRGSGGYLYVDSAALIDHLEDLGFEENTKRPRGSSGRGITIALPEDDPRWEPVFRLLGDYGMTWYPHNIVRRENHHKEFTISRLRTYTRKEICDADLLCLCGSSKPFADFRTDESGDGFEVEVTRRLNNRRDFGTSYYHTSVLMSERLKLLLEAAGLAATNFKPVRYNKPLKPDTKRLWQFESILRMPCCQTQRQDTLGHFVSELGPPPHGLGYYWDDAGYNPPELAFKHVEVQKLPSFDIAMTQELMGSPYCPQREIIVTQRFREAMEKHGVKTAQWVPVRLI